jgi:hypothetical protein
MNEFFEAIESHKLTAAILLIWSAYVLTISIKINDNESKS